MRMSSNGVVAAGELLTRKALSERDMVPRTGWLGENDGRQSREERE